MENAPIVIERTVNAPVNKVWEAITNKDLMKQWYFDIAEFEPKQGFNFEFSGGTEEKQYRHVCTIIEVIESRKLKHSWRYDGYEGKSFVTWELNPAGDRTRVKLTHEDLDTFPPIKDFAKENFVMGWTEIVGTNLPKFLESGS